MRFKNVFFYVDFFQGSDSVLTYRCFVWSGKGGGREWMDSALHVERSIDAIKLSLAKQFRNKLRSVQLEYSPKVSDALYPMMMSDSGLPITFSSTVSG